jgi:hypothetical protein
MAVGTVTFTRIPKKSSLGREYQIVQVDWTSTAGGAASDSVNLYGYLIKAVTVPSGAAAPTALYDITLVDGLTGLADSAKGILIDRSATVTEEVYGIAKNSSDVASYPILLCGDYTFTVANAGATKAGTCYLFLDEQI